MKTRLRMCIAFLLSPMILLSLGACQSSKLTGHALTLGGEKPAAESLAATGAFPFLKESHSGATEIESSSTAEDGAEVFVSRYAIVDGQDKGSELHMERRPAEQEGAWQIVTLLVAGGKSEKPKVTQEQTIALGKDGGAVMVASTDNAEGVIVELEPHMLALPGELTPSKKFEQESKMRLPLIENPKKTREHGSGAKTLELVGMQTVRSRAGTFECAHVREVFTSDLSMAKAVRTTDHWYAPGVGLIARRWEEKVTALGLTVQQRAQAFVVLAP